MRAKAKGFEETRPAPRGAPIGSDPRSLARDQATITKSELAMAKAAERT
jgi:hypothetical protein